MKLTLILQCAAGCLCCMHIDDVAVIDEVQMIEDLERGGAWTRALLGWLVTILLRVIAICLYLGVSITC